MTGTTLGAKLLSVKTGKSLHAGAAGHDVLTPVHEMLQTPKLGCSGNECRQNLLHQQLQMLFRYGTCSSSTPTLQMLWTGLSSYIFLPIDSGRQQHE